MKVPQDMADAILAVGKSTIKGTTMSYKTFADAVRKRFSSGGACPEGEDYDSEASMSPNHDEKEPPRKKQRPASGGARNITVTSSESDSSDHGEKEKVSEEEEENRTDPDSD